MMRIQVLFFFLFREANQGKNDTSTPRKNNDGHAIIIQPAQLNLHK